MRLTLNDKKNYIKLYIAGYCQEFKKRIYSPITYINDENVEQVVEQYARLKTTNRPIILEDIYYLSQSSQCKLLKFLEETELKVILLSSSDNISQMLINRCTDVYKRVPKVNSSFRPVNECRSSIDYGDLCYLDSIKKQMYNSPLLYRDDLMVKKFHNKEKLLSIIENEYRSKN